MGGEVRQQPELRAGQAHRPGTGRAGASPRPGRAAPAPPRPGSPGPGRSSSTPSVSVRTVRAARGLAQREMRARELEPDLDGHATEGHGRAAAADGGRASAPPAHPLSSLVQGDACRCNMDDRARRVVAETRLLDQRLCRPCALPGLAPGTLLGGEERELCLRGEIVVRGAAWPAPLSTAAARSSVARSVAPSSACATPRMRSALGAPRASGRRTARAPGSRRPARARHRLAS